MQAASLPISAGWFWLKAGFLLFKRQPMAMFTWAVGLAFLLLIASAIPPIGPLFYIALMPSITVMTLHACREIEAGRRVQPFALFSALKALGLFRKLLGMGGLYIAAVTAAGLLILLPFSGDVSDAIQQAQATNDSGVFFDALKLPISLFAIAYVTIAALFWHAPVLAAWHGMSLGKAMFFSGVACWRNKGAFVVYGICCFTIAFGLDLLGGLLGSMGLPSALVGMIQMPLSFLFAATLYCSFYPTYTTVFHAEPVIDEVA